MTVDHLGLIPEVLLLQADTLDALDQAAGEQVGVGPQNLVDLFVQQFEIGGRRFQVGAGILGGIAGFVFTVHQIAVGHIGIGDHGGVAHPFVAVLDHRHALGDQTQAVHLVGAPHLAGNAVPHGQFHGQHPGQKVRTAAVRRAAVLGAGLAVDRQVAGDGDVTGHADLLAAGHAHAVDPADGGFLAKQNRVHHGVEQIHVKTVLVGPLGVIFGILLGVAAGTEGLVAHGGEHAGHDGCIRGCPMETGDDGLDHLGGVGIVLLGVVQGHPG
ncbi:hypothetical protein DESC_370104 [Desulfosarcina cetonica]|nr:hypothetical protein DESC_370104 [Desulfosarcina cetonica]